MKPRIIIGLIGAPNSGRKVVSDHLVSNFGFTRIRFGDTIDRMLRLLGANDDNLSGPGLHQPMPELGGKSFLFAKQALGYHFGRRMVSEGLWIPPWRKRLQATDGHVVCDDIRFPNEADAIRDAGGVLVRIDRPNKSPANTKSGRVMLQIKHDCVLVNSGTAEELIALVDKELGPLFRKDESCLLH